MCEDYDEEYEAYMDQEGYEGDYGEEEDLDAMEEEEEPLEEDNPPADQPKDDVDPDDDGNRRGKAEKDDDGLGLDPMDLAMMGVAAGMAARTARPRPREQPPTKERTEAMPSQEELLKRYAQMEAKLDKPMKIGCFVLLCLLWAGLFILLLHGCE